MIIQNLKEERVKQKIQIQEINNFELETFSADMENTDLMRKATYKKFILKQKIPSGTTDIKI